MYLFKIFWNTIFELLIWTDILNYFLMSKLKFVPYNTFIGKTFMFKLRVLDW